MASAPLLPSVHGPGPRHIPFSQRISAFLVAFGCLLFAAFLAYTQKPVILHNTLVNLGLRHVIMGVNVRPFEESRPDVLLYTLKIDGVQAEITNWGATIVKLLLPNSSGGVDDVVLGFDELTPYTDGTSPYFGAIVGRVANRIADAKFSLDGQEHHVTANQAPNCLHGGARGFDKVVWSSEASESPEGPAVRLSHRSKDGEEGFPGDVDVWVTYRLLKGGVLAVEMGGKVLGDKATPLSLAQHTYWNLGGAGRGDILQHEIKINADHYTPVNEVLIPTGEIAAVEGTPFDFRDWQAIGSRIQQVSGGYDHNYVLKAPPGAGGDLRLAATVRDPASRRVLEVHTSAPGVQFYTGNFLDGVKGKEGRSYVKHGAFCLETQGFPNAVNEPKFPSVVLRPGQDYVHTMLYKFRLEEPSAV